MNCKEFKDLAPALALRALDESERLGCENHLLSTAPHDGCHEIESQTRLMASRLAGVLPEHPLRRRVWQAIERRLEASGAAPAAVRRRRRHTGRPPATGSPA
ncbi:MAG TPA: hypothetical protein VFH68_03570 [Polyangia bacterium]|jgi:hypothetical protein|nr:hypothetical protein [Polyangia bacterium]